MNKLQYAMVRLVLIDCVMQRVHFHFLMGRSAHGKVGGEMALGQKVPAKV